jgi:VWFA-related protein
VERAESRRVIRCVGVSDVLPKPAVAALAASLLFAQNEPRPIFRANVRMVVQPFTVTDSHGKPVSGLKAADIRILENGVPQDVAALVEGDKLVLRQDDASVGGSVFLLFDTSNRMYTLFPYVYDAITEFVRRLDPAESVAIYTFSRNLFRASPLTKDHVRARAGLANIAAGDDTALFNALLLTLRDAARVPGRKAVVVFSNGPDNASMIGPEDVSRVAEDEGIPIYIISTLDAAREPRLADALRTLTRRTGGRMYWAPRWQDQAAAFNSVREDIASSYTAYYYPAPDNDPGYRRIQIEMVSPEGAKWQVRARAGYEARPERPASESARRH